MVHDADAAPQEWGAPVGSAAVAVLTLHGRGLSPEWMREAAERFDSAATTARFFAPAAAGGSWYPESFLKPRATNQPALDSALAVIDACHTRILDAGFAPQNIVVWGFSQGACLLSDRLLSRDVGEASALLFTGGFLGSRAPEPPSPGAPPRRVVMRSIVGDPFVPPERVEATAAELRRRGSTVDLRIEPGTEHIISEEAFEAGSALLARAGSRAG